MSSYLVLISFLKLALQEKPQGSILTYYYKTNNLTRINWLNTRLINASNKIRHEIPFKTKRVKYTAIWKKSIKIVKESKLSFFFTTILIFSLIFNVFPPPPPPPPHFYCFPSSSSSSSGLSGQTQIWWSDFGLLAFSRENNRNEEEEEGKQ